MTRRQLADRVEYWRRLILPEWRVILHDKPLEDMDMDVDDAWAVCRTPGDYLKIQIHFSDKLLKEPLAEIEATVVHELLHALTRPWRNLLDGVSYELGNAKTSVLREGQEHEEEKLVDRLAYVLVARETGTQPVGTVQGEQKPGED